MTDPLPTTPATPESPLGTVTCPNCQTVQPYYDVNSSYYGCVTCHKLYKAEHEQRPEIVFTSPSAGVSGVALPLGIEGYLRGEWVRVVGIMQKQEKGTSYQWHEYVLFLKDGTTRQLAEYQGHWMWIAPANRTYHVDQYKSETYVDDTHGVYKLYARYQAGLLMAIGEFDWNITDDETLTIEEYILPPHMLVYEQNVYQKDWYIADYLSKQELEKAFDLEPDQLPPPYNTGAIEPNAAALEWPVVRTISLVGILAAILIHLLNIISWPSGTILREDFTTAALLPMLDSSSADAYTYTPARKTADSLRMITDTPSPKVNRSKSFMVNGPTALNLDLRAEVDNAWLELGTELVNETTNDRFYFTKALEYYHGYEGGENWNEGDKEESVTLSRIPSGTYHLEFTPYTQYGQAVPFTATIGQRTSMMSNVFLLMGLLVLYPIYLIIKKNLFEQSRWSQSDFGPSEA